MGKIINRVGETNIANNGMKMTIIAYRNCDDIDIQFGDGTIVHNKRYATFKNNTIRHPKIKTNKIDRTGETRIMNCGLKATIINYRNNDDIDIQFEDGTVTYNKRYAEFKKGEIGHPTVKKTNKINRTGETRIMNCGLKATIINYHNNNNIDIQFKNNIIVHNKTYTAFKTGSIRIPNIINDIKLKEFAYKFNNKWYYICSNPNWAEDKILSVKEIYAYQPN